MRILNGGELVIECLVRQGVKQVYSIAGGQMGSMYEAIGQSDEIDIFTPRNETAVPVMAAGYTAVSGAPAVSMTTVGAGVVYEVAGILKAWLDYIPVVSIAPQVQSYKTKPHQESLQSCNQDELFFPVTKWNTIVYHWDRIPKMIDRGFREALSGVPGPVHLDIPVDVLFRHKLLSRKKQRRIMPPPSHTRYDGRIRGDERQVDAAARALREAKKPLVLVGQGMGRRGRYPDMGGLLSRLGAPALFTRLSLGVGGGEDSFAGAVDGKASFSDRAREADVLLVIGIDRFARPIIEEFLEVAPDKNVVQVETDPMAHLAAQSNVLPVYADPISFLEAILADGEKPDLSWRDEVVNASRGMDFSGPENLKEVIGRLADTLGKDDVVVIDGEVCAAPACSLMGGKVSGGVFVNSIDDTPGGGLPFAIGAAMARPEGRVVLVCDKASLFRHVRELQPLTCGGGQINIVCFDGGGVDRNATDMVRVLSALGCRAAEFDEGGAWRSLLTREAGVTKALVVS